MPDLISMSKYWNLGEGYEFLAASDLIDSTVEYRALWMVSMGFWVPIGDIYLPTNPTAFNFSQYYSKRFGEDIMFRRPISTPPPDPNIPDDDATDSEPTSITSD